MAIRSSKRVLTDEERKKAMEELNALFANPKPKEKPKADVKALNKATHAKLDAEPERWTPGDFNWECTQGVTWIQQQVCQCCGGVVSAVAGELVEYRHKVTKAVRQVRRTGPLPDGTRAKLQVAQIQVERCFDCLYLEAKVDEVIEHLPGFNLVDFIGGNDAH